MKYEQGGQSQRFKHEPPTPNHLPETTRRDRVAVVVAGVAGTLLMLPMVLMSMVCLWRGLFGGAMLTGALGAFAGFMIFSDPVGHWSPRRTRRIRRAVYGVCAVSFLGGAVGLVTANHDGWHHVPGTGDWNNTRAALVDGRLLAQHGATDTGWLDVDKGGLEDLSFGGDFGFEIGHVQGLGQPGSRMLWSAPRDVPSVWACAQPCKRWVEVAAPVGAEHFELLAWTHHAAMASIDGKLFAWEGTPQDGHWTPVLSERIFSAAMAPGDWSQGLALGHKGGHWTQDGGLTWTPVGGLETLEAHADVAVGAGRWYVYRNSTTWKGTLMASDDPSAGRWESLKLPAPDVRTLVVDPDDGRHLWIGTWGQGIFQSTDGGKTWIFHGLLGMEVRSMSVDFKAGRAYVVSGNTVFDRGIFVRDYLNAPVDAPPR